MKRIYKLAGLALVIMMFLSGCGCKGNGTVVEKDAKRIASTGERWTVMIYMSASLTEEQYNRAGEVLNSLSYDLPENINVIVETGGCRKWSIDGIKNDRIQDFIVQKNGIKPIYETLLKSMGKSSTYADFLTRTMEEYPAEHYVSVIWGDGAGPVSGPAVDVTFDNDALTVSEIADAIADAGQKIDIVGFDSSFMSNLDAVAKLSLCADYLVAPEGDMPISGWNYRKFFGYISENPMADVETVGRVICDGVTTASDGEPIKNASMALVDLSKATGLVQEFDALTRYMAQTAEDTEKLSMIKHAVYNALTIGANSPWEGYSNLIDLKSFANCIFDATRDDVARLDNTIAKTVVYTSGEDKSLCGINIYYPLNADALQINKYKEISCSDGYKEYIDQTVADDFIEERTIDYKSIPSWQYYEATAGQNTMSAQSDLNGKYMLSISNPELIARVGVNVYKYDLEDGRYMYLSTDYNTTYSESKNAYEYEFDNMQLELNSIPVSYYRVFGNDEYELYSIPVMYNDNIASIRVRKNLTKENEYTVIGLWYGLNNVTGTIDRQYKKLGVGDVFAPIYDVYGTDIGEYAVGKSIKIVFGGLNVTKKTVKEGDYVVSYTVEDAYGKKSESNTSNVTALKGKLKVSN